MANATLIAETWRAGGVHGVPLDTAVGAYAHVVAVAFYLIGPSAIVARCTSALFGTLATWALYRVGMNLFDRRSALAAAGLYAVFPSIVYVHSETLRDPLIHLFILGLFAILTSCFRTVPFLVGVPGLLALIYVFRMPTLLVLLVPVGLLAYARVHAVAALPPFSSLHGPAGPYHGRPRKRWIIPVLAAGGLAILAVSPPYLAYLADLDGLAWYRDQWATGGSGYLMGREFNGFLGLAAFAPLSAAFFLFTPFPWQIHNGFALAAFLENVLFFYPIVFFSLRTMERQSKDLRHLGLILFLVIGALLYGIVEGNVGTALRHRAQFTWVFLLFAAPTIADRAGTVALRIARSRAWSRSFGPPRAPASVAGPRP